VSEPSSTCYIDRGEVLICLSRTTGYRKVMLVVNLELRVKVQDMPSIVLMPY
jgi:hypothetical protein